MTDQPATLHAAWHASSGNDYVDMLRRRSLSAGASQHPDLAPVVRSLELGQRAQLDLHLAGHEREDQHETSASKLGEFLKRCADAVRALAKSGSPISRLHGDLRVLAPSPGSVRIVFVEQARDEDEGQSFGLWELGMARLAETFDLAESGDDGLSGAVDSYSLQARRALELLGKTVAEQEWVIKGSHVSRDGSSRPTGLTQYSADRLVDAASRTKTDSKPYSTAGALDGWRWSNSTLRLRQERAGAIDVYVPERFRDQVAEWVAARGADRSLFEVGLVRHETLTSGGNIRATYELRTIKPVRSLFDDDPGLDDT